MLYKDFLNLWNESVQAVEAKDWQRALSRLKEIHEPTSQTLFNTASVQLALGRVDLALRALDHAIVKDERLAVAFFQRGALMMQTSRLEEALSDCIWAQNHMRGNMLIDYRQLGLQFKLYNWQVLYNAAAVHCCMGQWEQAREVLLSASQEKDRNRAVNLEVALNSVLRKEVLNPLLVPEGVVFRPRKQDVEQLQQRDFLGKAKVISAMTPNDDFAGFEPTRPQKPGFYEPNVEEAQNSRYKRLSVPYVSQGQGQLSVPRGAVVFLLGDEDRNGMLTVIYDGQRGQVPGSLLEPLDSRTSTNKKEKKNSNGIPFPPGLVPPTRPLAQSKSAPSPLENFTPESPYYNPDTSTLSAKDCPNMASIKTASMVQNEDEASVLLKIHYTYTVKLSVPLTAPYLEVKEKIAQKLNMPSSKLCLWYRPHGSKVLIPLVGAIDSVEKFTETGRATLWCQMEDPLIDYTVLYKMVALYDYTSQGPGDLEFSEGDTIDVLREVNEEWLEGHCAGVIGIFPRSFAFREDTFTSPGQEQGADGLQKVTL